MLREPIKTYRWHPPRSAVLRPKDKIQRVVRLLRQLSGTTRRSLDAKVGRIAAERARLQLMGSIELQAVLNECRGAFSRSRQLVRRCGGPSPLETALALLSLFCEQEIGMQPFNVQLLAVLAMYEGCIVQMLTGEGKTISMALTAVLHAWAGRPCHVVTANDYLAQRDSEFLTGFYGRCNLTVATASPGMSRETLLQNYAADILYATGKQLLADFLRDRLATGEVDSPLQHRLQRLRRPGALNGTVMRGLYAAVVDEADSVLIDEANTPLIISAPDRNELLLDAVRCAKELTKMLTPGRHYRIDLRGMTVEFTDRGEALLDDLTARLPALWRVPRRREELMRHAIVARDLFHRDQHYIVQDGKVVIVDENTGRRMPGRSWSYGLHQAIEAREGLEPTQPSCTLARMSFQAYFRCYHRLCGASGTLQGIEWELWRTYGLATLRVPSRLPRQLGLEPHGLFRTASEKRAALIQYVLELNRKGVPVLVGTRRIADSEAIAEALKDSGVACETLNAKNNAREADVIALAGSFGRITVATNMAGRGTDIKLAPGVAQMGGLHVLMLEPHESARVDWQLFGRAARQGDPGRAKMFVSFEDDLLRRHTPWLIRPLLHPFRWVRLREFCLTFLARLAQINAQRHFRRQRRLLIKREKLIEEQFTFAGPRVSASRETGLSEGNGAESYQSIKSK